MGPNSVWLSFGGQGLVAIVIDIISIHWGLAGKGKVGRRTECERGYFQYDPGWLWWPEEQRLCLRAQVQVQEDLISQKKLEMGSEISHLKTLAQIVLKHCEGPTKHNRGLSLIHGPLVSNHCLRKDGPRQTQQQGSLLLWETSMKLSLSMALDLCLRLSPAIYFICHSVSSCLER